MKLTVLLLGMLLIINCNRQKKFNFNRDWTWEELSQFTEDQDTQKYITDLQKKLQSEEAYFLFQKLDKIKNPKDIHLLADLEKIQREKGGHFFSIIPDFFKQAEIIPPPENFDYLVADAFYLGGIHAVINRYLATGGIDYNVNFKSQTLKPVNRNKANLDLHINTETIKKLLQLYKSKKIKPSEITEITESQTFKTMLDCRRAEQTKYPQALPNSEDLAYFIKLSTETGPIHSLWNWINPANNFGFAELSNNHERYSTLITYIEDNEQLFEDYILARLENYLPDNFQFNTNLDFAVNFGQMVWSTDDAVGVNIVHIKDDFHTYATAIRKEIFQKTHRQLCQKNGTLKPNFSNEKDQEYYEVLSFIYFTGCANFISGSPVNFDYITLAKDSYGFLEQIHRNLFVQPNDEFVKANKMMTLGENGMFTGLGYLMARTIERKTGKEMLALCVQNGPVHFFKTYLDLQAAGKTEKYFRFDATIDAKINEYYQKQVQNYIQ